MDQDPLEGGIIKSLYEEELDREMLNENAEPIETVLNLNEEGQQDVSSEMKV